MTMQRLKATKLASFERMASSFTPISSQTTLITITTIFILSTSLSSASTAINGEHSHPHPFKKIYAFGDSFTDTGNSVLLARTHAFWYAAKPRFPYGITFFHRASNRYSDGRLVIDFLAEALSLPYLPPYLNRKANASNGVNFAVSGSTAIGHGFFVKHNLSLALITQSLQTQLTWFNELLEGQGCEGAATRRECSAVFDDALIWVGEIGATDYAYTIGYPMPSSTIQNLAIKSITGFLQALLKKGAKYIVVQGLPPSGCLPLVMTLSPDDDRDEIGCVGSVNKLHYKYNAILQAKLHNLRVQFPHAVIAYADYWNAYHTVMKNADSYGFKESFRACCGPGEEPYNFNLLDVCGSNTTSSCPKPSQYINWDGFHLTEAMYKVLSDKFLHGKFCHPPFDYLLSRKQHQR